MKTFIAKPTKNDQRLAKQLIDFLNGQKGNLSFKSPGNVQIRIEDNDTPLHLTARVFELWLDVI